jgi:hypothetical protein
MTAQRIPVERREHRREGVIGQFGGHHVRCFAQVRRDWRTEDRASDLLHETNYGNQSHFAACCVGPLNMALTN